MIQPGEASPYTGRWNVQAADTSTGESFDESLARFADIHEPELAAIGHVGRAYFADNPSNHGVALVSPAIEHLPPTFMPSKLLRLAMQRVGGSLRRHSTDPSESISTPDLAVFPAGLPSTVEGVLMHPRLERTTKELAWRKTMGKTPESLGYIALRRRSPNSCVIGYMDPRQAVRLELDINILDILERHPTIERPTPPSYRRGHHRGPFSHGESM